MIYDDFREYIDQNVNLCMLKTLNYQAGQKPDYSDIHIQQLYLLRYVFSYAFEYKSMERSEKIISAIYLNFCNHLYNFL